MRIRGNVDGAWGARGWGTGPEGLGSHMAAIQRPRDNSEEGEALGGVEVKRRWSLFFDGETKLYRLREYRWTGETWHRVAELEFESLSSALDKIREGEDGGR